MYNDFSIKCIWSGFGWLSLSVRLRLYNDFFGEYISSGLDWLHSSVHVCGFVK